VRPHWQLIDWATQAQLLASLAVLDPQRHTPRLCWARTWAHVRTHVHTRVHTPPPTWPSCAALVAKQAAASDVTCAA